MREIENRERLIKLIRKAKDVRLFIADSSPEDKVETIHEGVLNDYVLREDGSLELWCNSGYEI